MHGRRDTGGEDVVFIVGEDGAVVKGVGNVFLFGFWFGLE